MGIAARSLHDNYDLKTDSMRLREIGVRFVSHVFPGETLIMESWKSPDNIYFEMRVKER